MPPVSHRLSGSIIVQLRIHHLERELVATTRTVKKEPASQWNPVSGIPDMKDVGLSGHCSRDASSMRFITTEAKLYKQRGSEHKFQGIATFQAAFEHLIGVFILQIPWPFLLGPPKGPEPLGNFNLLHTSCRFSNLRDIPLGTCGFSIVEEPTVFIQYASSNIRKKLQLHSLVCFNIGRTAFVCNPAGLADTLLVAKHARKGGECLHFCTTSISLRLRLKTAERDPFRDGRSARGSKRPPMESTGGESMILKPRARERW